MSAVDETLCRIRSIWKASLEKACQPQFRLPVEVDLSGALGQPLNKDICGVISRLVRGTRCKTLILAKNPLTAQCVALLAEALKHSHLHRLSLENCGLTSCSGTGIAVILEYCPSIVELVLSNNALGDQGIKKLSMHLTGLKSSVLGTRSERRSFYQSRVQSGHTFDAGYNASTDVSSDLRGSDLSHSGDVTPTSDLSPSPGISPGASPAISPRVVTPSGSSIARIRRAGSAIAALTTPSRAVTGKTLWDVLRRVTGAHTPQLRKLWVRNVQLSDSGVVQLARILTEDTVNLLDIAENDLTKKGLGLLGNALVHTTAMQELILDSLSATSWRSIFSCLASCPSLRRLSLNNNSIPIYDLHSLYKTILAQSQVRVLHLENVSYGNAVSSIPNRWAMENIAHFYRQDDRLIIFGDKKVPLDDGWSSLHYACLTGDYEEVEYLLNKSKQPLTRDSYGRTVLHQVAENGSLECFQAVLKYLHTFLKSEVWVKLLINYEGPNSESPLMVAAVGGHAPLVSQLLQHGAIVSRSGWESVLMIHQEHLACREIHEKEKRDKATEPSDMWGLSHSDVFEHTIRRQHDHDCQGGMELFSHIIDLLSPHALHHIRRSSWKRFMKTFLFYVVFLTSFTVVAGFQATRFDNTKFNVLKVVNDRITGHGGGHSTGGTQIGPLEGIHDIEAFWQWAQGSLMGAIFPTDLEQEQKLVLLDYNDLVGSVRLRQQRVREDTCGDIDASSAVPAHNSEGKPEVCYGKYTVANEETQSLGPKEWHQWKSGVELLNNKGFTGKLGYEYGGGGYVADLPNNNITEVRSILKQLELERWIDDPTRMVSVEFTLYNPFVNHFIAGQLVFEIPPSGGIFPNEQFTSFRLSRYTSTVDYVVLFVEILLVMCVLRLCAEEIIDFRAWIKRFLKHRRQKEIRELNLYNREPTFKQRLIHSITAWGSGLFSHFARDWNFIDGIVVLLLIYTYIIRITIFFEAHRIWQPSSDTFFDVHDIARLSAQEHNILSLTAMLCWLKVLKYIVILPQVGPAVQAIISTMTDSKVVSFMLVFGIVSISFSLALHLAFGYSADEYNTLGTALMSFFRLLFGDYNFAAFSAQSEFGWFWFVLSLLTGNLVLINIFIAVVGQVYDMHIMTATKHWRSKTISHYQLQLLESRRLTKNKTLLRTLHSILISYAASQSSYWIKNWMDEDAELVFEAAFFHYLLKSSVILNYRRPHHEHHYDGSDPGGHGGQLLATNSFSSAIAYEEAYLRKSFHHHGLRWQHEFSDSNSGDHMMRMTQVQQIPSTIPPANEVNNYANNYAYPVDMADMAEKLRDLEESRQEAVNVKNQLESRVEEQDEQYEIMCREKRDLENDIDGHVQQVDWLQKRSQKTEKELNEMKEGYIKSLELVKGILAESGVDKDVLVDDLMLNCNSLVTLIEYAKEPRSSTPDTTAQYLRAVCSASKATINLSDIGLRTSSLSGGSSQLDASDFPDSPMWDRTMSRRSAGSVRFANNRQVYEFNRSLSDLEIVESVYHTRNGSEIAIPRLPLNSIGASSSTQDAGLPPQWQKLLQGIKRVAQSYGIDIKVDGEWDLDNISDVLSSLEKKPKNSISEQQWRRVVEAIKKVAVAHGVADTINDIRDFDGILDMLSNLESKRNTTITATNGNGTQASPGVTRLLQVPDDASLRSHSPAGTYSRSPNFVHGRTASISSDAQSAWEEEKKEMEIAMDKASAQMLRASQESAKASQKCHDYENEIARLRAEMAEQGKVLHDCMQRLAIYSVGTGVKAKK